jgi:hypothetical protein
MRGTDFEQSGEQSGMFSYISAERRVTKVHPSRATRTMLDVALNDLRPRLDGLYARAGGGTLQVQRQITLN